MQINDDWIALLYCAIRKKHLSSVPFAHLQRCLHSVVQRVADQSALTGCEQAVTSQASQAWLRLLVNIVEQLFEYVSYMYMYMWLVIL